MHSQYLSHGLCFFPGVFYGTEDFYCNVVEFINLLKVSKHYLAFNLSSLFSCMA